MARIPGGEQFGQVVARPQQAVGADPNAYGAGIPIPRFAKYFSVENTNVGAGDVPAWVIFELE